VTADRLGAVEVMAAGAAVWRRTPSGTVEILVAHRPRYDDWSLPKGKCDVGETLLACARREVFEETGLTCEVGPELADVRYRDRKDRSKLVRYWAMEAVAGTFVANDEVDQVRWLAFPEAVGSLTYAHDRPVLRALVTTLATLDRLS